MEGGEIGRRALFRLSTLDSQLSTIPLLVRAAFCNLLKLRKTR